MELDAVVKLTIYRHFAETGQGPKAEDVAERVGAAATSVLESYRRLRALRVLVLEDDGMSIRMAPPFSGVPTLPPVGGGNQAMEQPVGPRRTVQSDVKVQRLARLFASRAHHG